VSASFTSSEPDPSAARTAAVPAVGPERYLGEYVVPELHGIDLTAPPSGALTRVAVIET
jgi:hypothetical protein